MEPEQPLDRLGAETSLLEAMYSDAVLSYDRTTQELSFKPSAGSGSRLILRLPDGYPASKSPPQVVLASDANKQDRRAQMTGFLKDLTADSSDGEYEEVGEILDQVIERFNEITESTTLDEHTQPTGNNSISTSPSKTVIVWLHHLLATSKRKLALHPSNSPTGAVSGLTKPGYPGIMVFSGPKQAVEDHVAELRGLNWQAFSVRYEEEVEWKFAQDTEGSKHGIAEVETMSEAAQLVEESKREEFLRAVGVK